MQSDLFGNVKRHKGKKTEVRDEPQEKLSLNLNFRLQTLIDFP